MVTNISNMEGTTTYILGMFVNTIEQHVF